MKIGALKVVENCTQIGKKSLVDFVRGQRETREQALVLVMRKYVSILLLLCVETFFVKKAYQKHVFSSSGIVKTGVRSMHLLAEHSTETNTHPPPHFVVIIPN